MVDLRSQYENIKDEINREMQGVIDSTAFVKGGKVADFQYHLEEYLGVKHVIPVGNGTDALQISFIESAKLHLHCSNVDRVSSV